MELFGYCKGIVSIVGWTFGSAVICMTYLHVASQSLSYLYHVLDNFFRFISVLQNILS